MKEIELLLLNEKHIGQGLDPKKLQERNYNEGSFRP